MTCSFWPTDFWQNVVESFKRAGLRNILLFRSIAFQVWQIVPHRFRLHPRPGSETNASADEAQQGDDRGVWWHDV